MVSAGLAPWRRGRQECHEPPDQESAMRAPLTKACTQWRELLERDRYHVLF